MVMAQHFPSSIFHAENTSDSGGIRTHATEVTGALNQRLRPLGHAILSLFEKKVEAIACVRELHFKKDQATTRLDSSSRPLWHIIGLSQ